MTPQAIVDEMMQADEFSRWLGVTITSTDKGSCKLECIVRNEMLNGHRIAHGGITYSLSDSALAFASNGHGNKCVSIETSIAHVNAVKSGDLLKVDCSEIYRGKTIGIYTVSIHNQDDVLVSRFKGTVHISEKVW
ncbi:MAG: acyl-CoA thioesterase [Flavobacteriaceae bacterium]|jgi:acyl-CoA thioesterase